MIDIGKEANAFASRPTGECLYALKRIIPRVRVEEVLARTGQDHSLQVIACRAAWSQRLVRLVRRREALRTRSPHAPRSTLHAPRPRPTDPSMPHDPSTPHDQKSLKCRFTLPLGMID